MQFGEDRTATGSGLLRFGLAPHQTVGIYSINCTAWVMVAEACSAYSMISVPLYDTLGPDAVRCYFIPPPPSPLGPPQPRPTLMPLHSCLNRMNGCFLSQRQYVSSV